VLIKFLRTVFLYPLEVIDAIAIFSSLRLRPKKIDVLFICHEADLGLYFRGSFLSRLIDPAAISLESAKIRYEKYLWQRVTRPGIRHSSYNRQSLRLIFSNTFTISLFLRYILKPKLIVAIPISACLKRVSDSLGIPTFEPFHGFGIGPKDHMWRTDQYVHTGSHFIAYDDQTQQTLLANQHRYFDVVRCAHPYLAVEQCLRRNLPSLFVRGGKCFADAYCESEGIDNKFPASRSNSILITLQHGYDDSHPIFKGILSNGFMHESLISVVKQRSDVTWIIKPHPVQMSSSKARQELFMFLDQTFSEFSNVFYQTCHLFDPVDLLRLSSLHITMMSSAIVEAYILGVHSICLCPTFRRGGPMETAFDLVRQNGFLHHVSLDQDSISDAITQLLVSANDKAFSYQQFFERESTHPSLAQVCADILHSSI
jgi:hypothetical protein